MLCIDYSCKWISFLDIVYFKRRNSRVKMFIMLIAKTALIVGKEIQAGMEKVDLQ